MGRDPERGTHPRVDVDIERVPVQGLGSMGAHAVSLAITAAVTWWAMARISSGVHTPSGTYG